MSAKIIKKITAFLLCLSLILSLTACGEAYDDAAALYVDLDSSPSILDPQLASTDSELIIIRNIFEGLMRYDANGKLVCGAAEKFEKSGLAYTFTLRSDLAWSNGDTLTADDFVFAFRRAVDKTTNAPFANKLFCISNAEAIYNGKANKNTLGVTAKDDKTLIFTLTYDDPFFLQILSQAIAMPCHQYTFYDAHGQYGLNDDYMVSNGSYRLRSWDTETKTVKLVRNAEYNGNFIAKNYSVALTNSQDDNLLLLEESRVDTALLKYNEFDKASKLYNLDSLQNTVWFLLLNKNSERLCDPILREAFIKSINFDTLHSTFSENSLSAANGYIPQVLLSDEIEETLVSYDIEYAKRLYKNATLKQNIKDFKLLYPQGMDKTAGSIAANWQQLLGAVVNTESVSNISGLNSRISASQYDMALIPVSTTSPDIYRYLKNFTSGETYGIDNATLDTLVSTLIAKRDVDNSTKKQIEAQLSKNYIIHPVATSLCGIASTDEILAQNYSLTEGYIDFAFFEKS